MGQDPVARVTGADPPGTTTYEWQEPPQNSEAEDGNGPEAGIRDLADHQSNPE